MHRPCLSLSKQMDAQEAKRYCREIVRVLRTLKDKRDMSLNEVKLTVAIEDPTKREQKEYMGIEVCAEFPYHAAFKAFLLLPL